MESLGTTHADGRPDTAWRAAIPEREGTGAGVGVQDSCSLPFKQRLSPAKLSSRLLVRKGAGVRLCWASRGPRSRPPTPVDGRCPLTPPPSKPSLLSSAQNQPSIFSPNLAQPGLLTHWAPFPYLLPPGAQASPSSPLPDSSPCPHHGPGTAGEGEPLAAGWSARPRTGRDFRPHVPLSAPAGGGERGIVSGRHGPPAPRSDFVGGPQAVVPPPAAGPGGAAGAHGAGVSAPATRSPGGPSCRAA